MRRCLRVFTAPSLGLSERHRSELHRKKRCDSFDRYCAGWLNSEAHHALLRVTRAGARQRQAQSRAPGGRAQRPLTAPPICLATLRMMLAVIAVPDDAPL